jgi:hypothetical protein
MVPRILGEVTKVAEVAGTEQLVTNKPYASAAVTKDEAKDNTKSCHRDGPIVNRFSLQA